MAQLNVVTNKSGIPMGLGGADGGLISLTSGNTAALDLRHSSNGTSLNLTNSGSADACGITKTGTGVGIYMTHQTTGDGLVIDKSNVGGGYGLYVMMGSTNTAAAMNVAHAGSGNGLTIAKTNTGAGTGITLAMGANTTGHGLSITGAGTGNGINVVMSKFSGAGYAAYFECLQSADVVYISKNTGGGVTGNGLTVVMGNGCSQNGILVTHAGAGYCIQASNTLSSAGGLRVDCSGSATGYGVFVNNSGGLGQSIYVSHTNASSLNNAVEIYNTVPATCCLKVNPNNATAFGFYANCGASTYGMVIDGSPSSQALRIVPTSGYGIVCATGNTGVNNAYFEKNAGSTANVYILNSSTSTGVSLVVQNSNAGNSSDVIQANTSGAGNLLNLQKSGTPQFTVGNNGWPTISSKAITKRYNTGSFRQSDGSLVLAGHAGHADWYGVHNGGAYSGFYGIEDRGVGAWFHVPLNDLPNGAQITGGAVRVYLYNYVTLGQAVVVWNRQATNSMWAYDDGLHGGSGPGWYTAGGFSSWTTGAVGNQYYTVGGTLTNPFTIDTDSYSYSLSLFINVEPTSKPAIYAYTAYVTYNYTQMKP